MAFVCGQALHHLGWAINKMAVPIQYVSQVTLCGRSFDIYQCDIEYAQELFGIKSTIA